MDDDEVVCPSGQVRLWIPSIGKYTCHGLTGRRHAEQLLHGYTGSLSEEAQLSADVLYENITRLLILEEVACQGHGGRPACNAQKGCRWDEGAMHCSPKEFDIQPAPGVRVPLRYASFEERFLRHHELRERYQLRQRTDARQLPPEVRAEWEFLDEHVRQIQLFSRVPYRNHRGF